MGKRDSLETAIALIGLWGLFLFGILTISNIPDILKVVGIFVDTLVIGVLGWVCLGKALKRKKDEIIFWAFIIVGSIDVFVSFCFAAIVLSVFYVNGVPVVLFSSVIFSYVFCAIGMIWIILICLATRRLKERKRRK
jgi:glucan phosphoethanolaminetransferase (alkaline phosphatase superfamily)